MPAYLSYDIRGIQSYIFSVPKLKSIIGASSLVDQLDRSTLPELALKIPGVEHIFGGGGRGCFYCDEDSIEPCRKAVMNSAHKIGVDVRIGVDIDITKATNGAQKLYSWLPDSMDGVPCSESGLFPVGPGVGKGKGGKIHPIIESKIQAGRDDAQGRRIMEALQQRGKLPAGLQGLHLAFFKNVGRGENSVEEQESQEAYEALGSRNRWAVVAMDGNDLGSQYKAHFEAKPGAKASVDWLKSMSQKLASITFEALLEGLEIAIKIWWAGTQQDRSDTKRAQLGEDIILPFRPLVIGGDDILILCHSSLAFAFAQHATEAFGRLSRQRPDLWQGTGGQLSISTGILFCNTSYPLHTALQYAESLLASAKGKGRELGGSPSTPCVDWESVTDSLLDTPTARRRRDWVFEDTEVSEKIILTQRPYDWKDWTGRLAPLVETLSQDQHFSKSQLETMRRGLMGNVYDRRFYRESVGKQHPKLYDLLNENDVSIWTKKLNGEKGTMWSTALVDATLVLQEQRRFEDMVL